MLYWKGPGTYPQSLKLFKRFLKIIVIVYINQLAKFGDLTSCGSKDSKMHSVSCTNTHDIIDLVYLELVQNTRAWISWEWNMTFLWDKKILKLCLNWHILIYPFLAEVTFKCSSYVFSLDNIVGNRFRVTFLQVSKQIV